MGQSLVQSTAAANFGGASQTVTLTLNGVTAGNRVEVRVEGWGFHTLPGFTVSDGSNTYSYVRAQDSSISFSKYETTLAYVISSVGGNLTITVTHNGEASNWYGWAKALEWSGGDVLDTGVTNTATGTSSTPSITAAGATAQANNLIVAMCGVNASTTDVGLDAASGNSLTWTNRLIEQDPNTESAVSADDAPSTSVITPTCSWGTLTGSDQYAALIVAFKDAASGGGGSTPAGRRALLGVGV